MRAFETSRFSVRGRWLALLLGLLVGVPVPRPAAAQQNTNAKPAAPPETVFQPDVRFQARDGVELALRLWRPETVEQVPVVLQHTPYLSDETHLRAQKFVAAGFAYASLDRRGRGVSGGDYVPLENSGPDGADAVAWLAAQPWSDGRVASMGGSSRGMTQWQMLAEQPPALLAAAPTASVYPGWDFPQPRGIFLSYMAQWLAFTDGRASNTQVFGDVSYWRGKYERIHRGELPFSELARISGAPQARFERWLAHPGFDSHWRSLNPSAEDYARMQPPLLSITGYFDGDQEGTLRYYEEHLRHASADIADRHWLLIGPWNHAGTRTPTRTVGGLEFADAAILDIDALHIAWFNHVLRGAERPAALAGRVNYYVMGAEEWRHADTLQDVAAHTWALYLDPDGADATSVFHSGRLGAAPPARATPSSYRFDPSVVHGGEPVLTSGPDTYAGHAGAGRPNQLFFHSAPLPAARTVCGQIRFQAHIEIDVPDTDVHVELFEVDAKQAIRWLGRDYLRARFRESFSEERLAQPGRIETWNFDRFWWTCRRLEAGSRLRLVIGPVDTPDLQKNLHTGGRIGFERMEDARTATVRLHHDRRYPSRLLLPTVEPID